MRKTALVVTLDNLDLSIRRKRLGLTQQQVADLIGIASGSSVSRFETEGTPLPHQKTRHDVERALDIYEQGLRAGESSGK